MYRITLLLFIVASAGVAATNRDWKLGRVLDSTSSKTTFETGATSNTNTTGTATANTTGTATTMVPGTTHLDATTTATGQSHSTTTTMIHHMTIRDTELLVVGQDYAYVIEDPYAVSGPLLRRAITNHKHGCRFIIGEDIKYVQERGKLIVLDPDAKECSLDIIKQERIQH